MTYLSAAQTATEVAPWWGVPVIAGSFLVAGAVLGYIFNRLQDGRRAKREDAQRWDHEVLARSERYLTAVTVLWQANEAYGRAVLNSRPAKDHPNEILRQEALVTLDRAMKEFVIRVQEVSLLMPDSSLSTVVELQTEFTKVQATQGSTEVPPVMAPSRLIQGFIEEVQSIIGFDNYLKARKRKSARQGRS